MRVALLALLCAAPAMAQHEHTVRPGQTLAAIAHRYHVSVADLTAANRIRGPSMLRPGQVLSVPSRGVTYVRPGQTLAQIAREHQCAVDELMRLNRMRSGARLRAGQELRLPGFEPAEDEAADRDWGPPSEPGLVSLRRHDGVVAIRLVDAEGRITREGLEALGRLMRRTEEDPVELPHPRLVRVLAAISDHFGGREITIVSGRREARGFTREGSRHVSGHASDIFVRGVPRRTLWDYCRSLSATGCGYYPRSTFVHVDVRDPATQWVDWSAPGQRPRYGTLRGPWRLRRGRPPANRERVSRAITRPDEVPIAVELTSGAHAIMPVVPPLVRGEEPDDVPGEDEGEIGEASEIGDEAPELEPIEMDGGDAELDLSEPG